MLALFIGVEVLILARFSLVGLRHVQNTTDAKAVAGTATPNSTIPSSAILSPATPSPTTESDIPQPPSLANGSGSPQKVTQDNATRDIEQKQDTTQRAKNSTNNEDAAQSAEQYQQGLEQGYAAAVAVQQAKTKDQWQQADDLWEVAIATLTQIPPDSNHHETAQAKAAEYTQNQTYARQAAAQSQTALTQLRWDVGLIDPTQTLFRDLKAGTAKGWIEATVAEGWHLYPQETRLTTAQSLQQQWATLYSLQPDQADAKIRLVTDTGKTVGISRRQGTDIELTDE